MLSFSCTALYCTQPCCWSLTIICPTGLLIWNLKKLWAVILPVLFPVRPHCTNARRNRCQKDPFSFPFGELEKTTRSGRSHTTWMKTIQQDMKSNNFSLNEAMNVAQSHPLWRLMSTFGAIHLSGACHTRRRLYVLVLVWPMLLPTSIDGGMVSTVYTRV